MSTSISTAFAGHGQIAPPCLEALAGDRNVRVSTVLIHPSRSEPAANANDLLIEISRGIGCSIARVERTDDILRVLQPATADLLVSVGFLRIFTADVLALFRFGGINIHGALLPRYRGRASISWALINGEKVIGVTVHYMDEGVDSGDIILQRRIGVSIRDTATTLFEKVKKISPGFLLEAVRMFEHGTPTGVPQDESMSTRNGPLTPDVCRIRWNETARRVHDRIRALVRPYPGAYTFYGGKRYFIWKSSPVDAEFTRRAPGMILEKTGRGVLVETGEGALLVGEAEEAAGGGCVQDWEVGRVLSESEHSDYEPDR